MQARNSKEERAVKDEYTYKASKARELPGHYETKNTGATCVLQPFPKKVLIFL